MNQSLSLWQNWLGIIPNTNYSNINIIYKANIFASKSCKNFPLKLKLVFPFPLFDISYLIKFPKNVLKSTL